MKAATLTEVAPDVIHVGMGLFSCFLVGSATKPWMLVDSGPPHSADRVLDAARRRFGVGSQPECILLTHGHFDHAGSAAELADFWNVPVYAHPMELTFLTGGSEYPPADPTVGGFFSLMVRFMDDPNPTHNLGSRIHALPAEGKVPGLSDWEWHHTPGHTPGHVAYFRNADRTLLAGDAFALVNFNSAFGLLTNRQELSPPAPPITSDWGEASESIRKLAQLKPNTIAPGHGKPLAGEGAAEQLQTFATRFVPPGHGRYVRTPAKLDERGVINLPPVPPDPFNSRALGFSVALTGGLSLLWLRERLRNERRC